MEIITLMVGHVQVLKVMVTLIIIKILNVRYRYGFIFESMSESLGSSFDETFVRGVELLKTVNEKLALAYRELLALACDIIIASDGVVTSAELDELKRVKSLFA